MQLLDAVATPSKTLGVPQPRLVAAAHEFEAQMMKELLKPLSNGESLGREGTDDCGSGAGLADFAAETLAQSLSRSGGLGLATSILQSLSHLETKAKSHADIERTEEKS
jgi:Rod binding domain-containing protein